MKSYEEVCAPRISGTCKDSTSIAAHVVLRCEDGCTVDIVRYYGTGRCRLFLSGTADDPQDEMCIYASVRRLPHSIGRLLGLAVQSSLPCISALYDGSALHLVHYGTARIYQISNEFGGCVLCLK